jgi:hypothetical protein
VNKKWPGGRVLVAGILDEEKLSRDGRRRRKKKDLG